MYTPTPWIQEGRDILGGTQQSCHVTTVCLHGPWKDEQVVSDSNAALIVKAVNSYEAMKEALEALTQRVPEMMNMSQYYDGQVCQALDNAKKALALAEGKDS